MGMVDFIDIANALHKVEEEQRDWEYQRTAWQTALLMNATGNYGKKQIKPEMLYESPLTKTGEGKKANNSKKDKQYIENEQAKLKAMFDLE